MVLYGPKKRIGKVEREILESISTGDLLVGFLCSARSIRQMNAIAYERALTRYRTRKTIDALVSKGFASINGDSISITQEGRGVLESAVQRTRSRLEDSSWDGKWRMVTYDIPSNNNNLRNKVRYTLKRAGFRKLHNSIWVYPHDCVELTDLIKSDRRLKSCVLYGVLEKIENDSMLRTLFGVDN